MSEGCWSEPEKRAAPFSTILIAAGIILLLSSSYAWEIGRDGQVLPPDYQGQALLLRPLVLVIIDFDSFSCLPCLDSFLDFHRLLSGSGVECLLWGVLVFDSDRAKRFGPTFIQILEKKLEGFIKGNRLLFPIVIDRYHVFESLGEEGSAVLVFDPKAGVMRKYVFPLRPNQIQDILHLLGERSQR